MQLSYRFIDSNLKKLALTHRSVGKPNNERLEFLGDALLGAFVAEMLYEVHAKASEGELSLLRSQLVSGSALALLARDLEIGDRLNLGVGELKSGGFRRDSILAGALEAMIAAIYLDGGLDVCRTVVREIFAARVASLHYSSKDAKTRLQEYLQARGWPLPRYDVKHVHGAAHARTFHVSCIIMQPIPVDADGHGSSRRAAEQEAAELVLVHLSTVQVPN